MSRWLIALVLLILLNFLGSRITGKIDLTEEKRYTLTDATQELLAEQDDPIYVDVLLEGTFPAGFKRLQAATRELLDEFRAINPSLIYSFRDPLAGDRAEVEAYLQQLMQVGIRPTELSVRSREGTEKKQIFPYAIFNFGDRQIAINLLEQESHSRSPEQTLNQAISLLEFKAANAIAKLHATQKPNILFSTGHGELSAQETAGLENNLRAFYNTGRINLDSIYQIPETVDLVIVAKPVSTFSQKEQFVLDQYIVNGGNLMFLIDPLTVNLDSIQKNNAYIPHDIELGLEDMFFRYGFRIQRDLVLDLECSTIPLQTGMQGGEPQFKMFPWYYHILAQGNLQHPITKSIERVNLFFPASIDTIKTRTQIRKTPLLTSSPGTRTQMNPVMLDFNMLRTNPDPDKFNKPPATLALMLEGSFPSLFENRVSGEMHEMLREIGASYKSVGSAGKILVVSDGDVARSYVNPRDGSIRAPGYNQFMKYTFGNADFLVNAVEYMLDQRGLIESRARTIRLRLLDARKIEQEKSFWQFLNVGLPLVILAVFAFIFAFMRKRRYAK